MAAGGIPNVPGGDMDGGPRPANLENIKTVEETPEYQTDEGTVIRLNSLTRTTPPEGAGLEALIVFVDESGLDTVLITGGSEAIGHSANSFTPDTWPLT